MPNGYNSKFTGQHNDQYDNRIEALENQITALQNQITALQNQNTDLQNQNIDLQNQINNKIASTTYTGITLNSWTSASSGGYYCRLVANGTNLPTTALNQIKNLLNVKISSYTGSWRIFNWETYENDICIYSNYNGSTTVTFTLIYYIE